MTDLKKFTLKRKSEEANEGVFTIGPLPRGYGYTIANPIRRILLSSLSGGAVTGVKIAGVDHEYSTISGVQDDVLKIIIRLKSIALKSFSDEAVTAMIDVTAKKGEIRNVTAADISADASIEIMNKDQLITTVSNGGTFRAELTIEKGVGFKVADSEKRSEIGLIPVDGNFSPVENVRVKISDARVGQRTDLDQIELYVKTNGVVTPSEAVTEACHIFSSIASRLLELSGGSMDGEEKSNDEVQSNDAPQSLGIPVKNLKLSTRLRNALMNSAIVDLSVLDGKSLEELMEIRGMGQKSAEELVTVLEENGLKVNK